MVVCEDLVKIYKCKDIEVVALQGLDLNIEDGEMMGIIGSSGSGKSTLLNMIGGLDRPSAGILKVDGKNLLKMTDKELMKFRRDTVGFMWQNSARNLIPYLTAVQNVELPMFLKGKHKKERALELLDMVGMINKKDKVLQELSGGEQQRISMAVALSNDPKIFLADEPTGAVDTKNAEMILNVLRKLNKELNITIIIVTHDLSLSKKVDRVVSIKDGRTSTEFLSITSYDEFDDVEEKYIEEYAVLDKFGRLQIPEEYLNALNIKGKSNVKVKMGEGNILIEPIKNKS